MTSPLSATSAPASPVSALGAVPMFAALSEETLAELAASVRLRRYRRGEVIFHRGDPGTTMFVIASGRVKITVPTESGDEAMLAVMRPGEFFGELSVLDGAPRSATAIAMETVEAWALHREDLLRPLLDAPGVIALLSTLARRLRRADAQVEEIGYLDLESRLARALLRLAEDHGVETAEGVVIDLPLTQTDLAALVGATRPRVNLTLGAFQDAGLVRLAGRSVILRDLPAFRARAGLAG